MIIRDVNSYIAQDVKGKVKYKGAFKTYSEMIKDEEYHKSFSQTVVSEAIAKFYLEGIPVEETVMGATDIYDFCKTFNASHGWKCGLIEMDAEDVEGTDHVDWQQKTNRYYMSTDGQIFKKYKDVRALSIEAKGYVQIFNTYEKKDMIDYDIDYDYYIRECYKIIHKVDGTERRELEAARKAKELAKREKQEANFMKYCWNKPPTERQLRIYGKEWLIEKYGRPEIKK